MLGTCRICFRYTQVGNDRVCSRCSTQEEQKVPNKLKLVYHRGQFRVENLSSGKILSKEDWFYIKRRVDGFYNSTSSDDIDWINQEIEREQKQKERRIKAGHIYLMKSDNGYYKIGRTTDVSIRNKQHMRDYPLTITVIHSFYCKNYVKAETFLLRMFTDKKLQGEWFELDQDDVRFITNITEEIALKMF